MLEHDLSRDDRVRLLLDLCEAVQFAHRNLIVHRDIKAANVLIENEGRLKLFDFGIAKLIGDDHQGVDETVMTVAGTTTPHYASPKQIRGEFVTPLIDVYSMGVLLYELLSGHRRYDTQTRCPTEIERIICLSEPAPPLPRARDRAAREAAVATETADFLIGLFAVSDPRETNPVDVRARDLLDQAAKELPEALNRDPLMRAQHAGDDYVRIASGLVTQGRLLADLGQEDEGLVLMRHAIALHEAAGSLDEYRAAATERSLALLLLDLGEAEEAAYWGLRALEIAARELPAGSPELERFEWPPRPEVSSRI